MGRSAAAWQRTHGRYGVFRRSEEHMLKRMRFGPAALGGMTLRAERVG